MVLVADDNPDILRLVAGRLRRRGYEVLTAGDGREALALIVEREPAVAVLDWVMPQLTGPEVCARAKARTGTAIVLLTARATDEDRHAAAECGADAYLTKPFEIDDLVAAVAGLAPSPPEAAA